jgi:hypothetical protein
MLDITPNTRSSIITAAIFAGLALVLASPSFLPRAVAEEQPAKTLLSTGNDLFPRVIDPSTLTKWDFVAEPGVSTEALHVSQVRKIAYGETSFVNVVQTATGVYSSDALTDPHVQYPGIHAKRRNSPFAFLLLDGGSWIAGTPFGAGSFVTIVPFEGGQLVTTDDGQCVVGARSVSC